MKILSVKIDGNTDILPFDDQDEWDDEVVIKKVEQGKWICIERENDISFIYRVSEEEYWCFTDGMTLHKKKIDGKWIRLGTVNGFIKDLQNLYKLEARMVELERRREQRDRLREILSAEIDDRPIEGKSLNQIREEILERRQNKDIKKS